MYTPKILVMALCGMCVVSTALLPLYLNTHWVGGWVGPRTSLDTVE
jgi:hypothetical protein